MSTCISLSHVLRHASTLDTRCSCESRSLKDPHGESVKAKSDLCMLQQQLRVLTYVCAIRKKLQALAAAAHLLNVDPQALTSLGRTDERKPGRASSRWSPQLLELSDRSSGPVVSM